jgi:internalin A
MIEQHLSGDGWGGTIKLETKSGQAAELLERLIGWIRQVNDRLGLQPELTRSVPERAISPSQTAMDKPGISEPPLVFAPERKAPVQYCVSYAWGDDTETGRERAEIVDRLCREAEDRGIAILRDKTAMGMGDRISVFMRRLVQGDRIFVILSRKYLQSVFCMTELYWIWLECRANDQAFIDRVRVFVLPDANISTLAERAAHTIFWRGQYDELKKLNDLDVLSVSDYEQYRRIGKFVQDVREILSLVADTLRPTTFDDLVKYGLDEP